MLLQPADQVRDLQCEPRPPWRHQRQLDGQPAGVQVVGRADERGQVHKLDLRAEPLDRARGRARE